MSLRSIEASCVRVRVIAAREPARGGIGGQWPPEAAILAESANTTQNLQTPPAESQIPPLCEVACLPQAAAAVGGS
jgi:hypothetical protein